MNNLMIQGTMSNAGKSIVTAGLLRMLYQDGYRVAPFKSQNMALNSYITEEGWEMGRAQVVQAEAAGIKPDVRMNPILLKPNSDMGSQVILNGEVLGNFHARDYFGMKKKFIPQILEAYEYLQSQYDFVIIEGAGSPAEINLRENDIVNMGLAELVDTPVLLVGDIDRGGVFAQLLGTIWLLEQQEAERIKGFVINKFRGDPKILEPGLVQLYEKCPIPVTGVIPYMHLDIEDEDSLSERLIPKKTKGIIDVVIIKVPHLSNFTDFSVLEGLSQLSIRYITQAKEIKNPDLIILPGTKNTMNDLLWMRQNGIEARIQQLASSGTRILGICGGYQMLGHQLQDPFNVEHGGVLKGMGLLPIETTFTTSKHRSRVTGTVNAFDGVYEKLQKQPIEGYEIHMGESKPLPGYQSFAVLKNTIDNNCIEDGCVAHNVLGTYVHGVLDNIDFLKAMFEPIYKSKGLESNLDDLISYEAYKELQYNKLAETMRAHIDMDAIYQLLKFRR